MGVRTRAANRGTALGRADLLRAYLELGGAGLEAMAQWLGYRKVDDGPSVEAPKPVATKPGGQLSKPDVRVATRAPTEWLPVPMWRQESISSRFEAEELKQIERVGEVAGLTAADLTRPPLDPPKAPPIVAWPRLRRVLDDAIRISRPSRAIDVDRLVDDWARGRVLGALPRRSAVATARIAIILDGSRRLVPTWVDQATLVARLVEREGLGRVRLLPAPRSATKVRSAREPARDEVVLALSDLGALADDVSREQWARLGRSLRAQGTRFCALSPCPASRRHGSVERVWPTIDWQRPGSARAVAVGVRPAAGERSATELLLAAVSPAVRVEPGLLRTIRQILLRHGKAVWLDSEVEIWRHPQVSGGSSRAFAIELEHAASWQLKFAELPSEIRADIARAILRWHRGFGLEIRSLEVLQLLAAGVPESCLGRKVVREAQDFLSAAAESLVGDDGSARKVEPWAERLLRRGSRRVLALPGFRLHLNRLGRALHQKLGHSLKTAAVTPEMIAKTDPVTPPRRVLIVQVGNALEIRGPEDRAGFKNPPPGSPLAEITCREELLVGGDSGAAQEFDLELETPSVACPGVGAALTLTSDVEEIRLEPFDTLPWAVASGRDEYGLWATFEVEGAQQRMRWIPPGRAWLGSPMGESGRFDDWELEPELHTFKEGFWLADTPCTQKLWLAVMGENPSEYQDLERPVERVSYEECVAFVDKLRDEERGLFPRLPFEFQWEYACRSGTRTATWLGDLEIRGERNAPLLHEIAWYGGNSGDGYELEKGWDTSAWNEMQFPNKKAGTRRVATKKPNPFGLYDMLGNVFEWTSTKWSTSDADESALRVIRGGSWVSDARLVRAAFRFWVRPGFRNVSLGFRLSLGREPGAEPKGESRRPAPEGVSERGTSRSAPGRDFGAGGRR